MRSDLPYWLALARFPAFGAVRIGRLADAFGNMQDAFEANASALIAAGIDETIAQRFISERSTIDPEAEMKRLNDSGLNVLTVKDETYPPALRELYDPPAVLFYRGDVPDAGRPHLAVVGSRHPTGYGLRCVERLVEPLASAGVVIVSGLAYGIDAAAHEAALRVGGETIAVLGSGADEESVYPSRHRHLAKQIERAGVVVSERPPGTPGLKQYFPARNRLIAGFCRVTLVVEAAADSGSLITTQTALEIGRDVAAVPGPIESPLSVGPHKLIKNGAAAITDANDLFELLNLVVPKSRDQAPLPEFVGDEKTLFEILSQEPLHIDDLCRRTNLPSHAVASALTGLELKGACRHVGGRNYVRS